MIIYNLLKLKWVHLKHYSSHIPTRYQPYFSLSFFFNRRNRKSTTPFWLTNLSLLLPAHRTTASHRTITTSNRQPSLSRRRRPPTLWIPNFVFFLFLLEISPSQFKVLNEFRFVWDFCFIFYFIYLFIFFWGISRMISGSF